jgi:hypothetical protein
VFNNCVYLYRNHVTTGLSAPRLVVCRYQFQNSPGHVPSAPEQVEARLLTDVSPVLVEGGQGGPPGDIGHCAPYEAGYVKSRFDWVNLLFELTRGGLRRLVRGPIQRYARRRLF